MRRLAIISTFYWLTSADRWTAELAADWWADGLRIASTSNSLKNSVLSAPFEGQMQRRSFVLNVS